MEIWEIETPGTFWATPGLLRDCFTLQIFSCLPLSRLFLKISNELAENMPVYRGLNDGSKYGRYQLYTLSEKDCTLFLFFFLGGHCVESGVSCTDCY